MAPAPAPPSRKGFDLSKPGGKEYLIAGGVALAGALVYFWWKRRQGGTAAPSATDTTGTTPPASPTGLTTGALLAWIADHSASPGPRGPKGATGARGPRGKAAPGDRDTPDRDTDRDTPPRTDSDAGGSSAGGGSSPPRRKVRKHLSNPPVGTRKVP